MAIRTAWEPLGDVPKRLGDDSRLVGVVREGEPVYHDTDDAVLRAIGGSSDGSSEDTDDVPYRQPIDADESIADAITTVERRHGWAVLSEYGLEHLSDG